MFLHVGLFFTLCNQRSLASYIKKYAYSNVTTEDLWAALEEESGQPVKNLMNTWTKQQGYPVVSVKVNAGKVEFEQVMWSLISIPIACLTVFFFPYICYEFWCLKTIILC